MVQIEGDTDEAVKVTMGDDAGVDPDGGGHGSEEKCSSSGQIKGITNGITSYIGYSFRKVHCKLRKKEQKAKK